MEACRSTTGFDVLEMRGIPAPFPLAVVSRSLFAYQIFAVVQSKPTLESLLDHAQQESGRRSAALPTPSGPTRGA